VKGNSLRGQRRGFLFRKMKREMMKKISDLFQILLFLGSVALGTAFGMFLIAYINRQLFSYDTALDDGAQLGGAIIGVIGMILLMLPGYFSPSSPNKEEIEAVRKKEQEVSE
jgi:hypothetical protein